MDNYSDIRNKLKTAEFVAYPFELLSKISKICVINQSIGRDLVIRALDQRKRLKEEYKAILDELAIQVGLYPYIELLESLSTRSAIRHASHRADGEMSDFVIHSAQARILQKLISGESVILSAPTSFGKSLLIDLTIAAKKFDNIVLIVPTLALVEETRRRMSKFLDRYSVITTSLQKLTLKNIFVLTQERYLSMRDEIPGVDFFVIDEFYKLSISEDGERSTRLNQAFLSLLESQAQFYLLGPSIGEIPEIVKQRTNCNFLIEDFQTVAVELHLKSKKPTKLDALANILDEVSGQTMIYCASPLSTRKLIRAYLGIRQIPYTQDKEILEAAKWTAENYHDQWLVSVALQHGIGIHHGKLPRALGRFMIRAFEEKKLKLLLCTSTLIEGVNTTAKNIIIFDNTINKRKLDFFTFNNIKGRSGRMFQHFIGHVYIFDNPPQSELPFVDFPALNPTDLTPSSLLINMPLSSIPDFLKPKVYNLIKQDHLPISLLRKLSGIEPEFLIRTAKLQNSVQN